MTPQNINFFTKKCSLNIMKGHDPFFRALVLHWKEIINNHKVSRCSIPARITINNDDSTLIIFSYDGSATLYLQGMIKRIEQNIKLHVGYFPVNSIRIIQKSSIIF